MSANNLKNTSPNTMPSDDCQPELAPTSSSASSGSGAPNAGASGLPNNSGLPGTPNPTGASLFDNGDTVNEFLVANDYSPVAKAETMCMASVRVVMDGLGFDWQLWDAETLAKMAFLVLHNQHTLLLQHNMEASELIWLALDEKTKYGKRLAIYIRCGGDFRLDAHMFEHSDWLEHFLENHPDWKNSQTLFNAGDNSFKGVGAFIRFQNEGSQLCYLVAVANAIYYSMSRRQQVQDPSTPLHHYALNISRFMRNMFTDQEIFDDIFKGEGGYPYLMMSRILAPFNHEGINNYDVVKINPKHSALVVAANMETAIEEYGALIIERFKVFPEFYQEGKTSYGGDYETKERYNEQERNVNHAMTVVGVKPTGDVAVMGGVKFFLQNSYESKPFVEVGLDLLRSMGVTRFIAVPEDVHFDAHSLNMSLPASPHAAVSGVSAGQNMEPLILDFDSAVAGGYSEPEAVSGFSAKYWEKVEN